MHDDMNGFVRRLRRRLDMTQEELAHAIGITVGTVNRWENVHFRPSRLARATILDLARRHGVSVHSAGSDPPARHETGSDKPRQ